MRILIHGLNFAPELTGIGKYTDEMAAFLAAQGHQVRVVTTPPYYPHWRVGSGYSAWQYRREHWQGVDVFRCPLWVPLRPTGLKRVIHLASFAVSSLPVMIAQAAWRPHLVFNIAPAIASTPAAWITARLGGSRAWLHIQDFELDAALRLKMLPGLSLIGSLLLALERLCYLGFDRLSTISQPMVRHLCEKGVPASKIYLLPNWVDTKAIYPLAGPNSYREGWNLPEGAVVCLYSGNMGHKQGLELLVEAAHRLKGERSLHFVLCGDGAARPQLEEAAVGLENIRFLPLQPVEQLNELLNAADIHLLPQRAGAADLVMPSKLGGMLASGRPVIATANPGTELARVVQDAGRVTAPEDAGAIAEAVLDLSRNPAERLQLGALGRSFVEQHWSKEVVLTDLLSEIAAIDRIG